MNQRIIGIVLVVLGAICVVGYGAFFVLFGLMVISPAPQTRQQAFEAVAILDALFSPLVICGAVMLFIGFRLRRRGIELESIRANVMSHERVEVNWLSSQMGLDVMRTRKLLLDAIGRGLVRGEFASESLFISGWILARFTATQFRARDAARWCNRSYETATLWYVRIAEQPPRLHPLRDRPILAFRTISRQDE